MKFAILAEDDSDAEVLWHIVRRCFGDDRMTVKKKGYDGCGGLCRKGARDIKQWLRQGITRFVICHDADSNVPSDIREKVLAEIVRPSGVEPACCIAVPVQEIEAWLIADEEAIAKVLPGFRLKGHPQPENIQSPKEWLLEKSKAANGKPLYAPKTFNPAVAKHIRFDLVQRKCPSFKTLMDCLSANL